MTLEKLEKWKTGMILHYLSWVEDLCEKCEAKEKMDSDKDRSGTGRKGKSMTRPNGLVTPRGKSHLYNAA